ncbi:MAG: glycosyltransferase family 2 protein [Bacteroidetes bacterium]|nr:glycosyltransferase family 2 protein [Bacteroidota bacterium]
MPLQQTTDTLPLVSIIVTSYNRAASVTKAIDSALEQDYPNIEVIVSDNRSTDNTMEVLSAYTGNPRVRISQNAQNVGMMPNFKIATDQLAKGEYVMYISSDDYMVNPGFVSEAMDIIQQNPAVRLVFGVMITYNIHADRKARFNTTPLWEKNLWNGFEVLKQYPENGSLCFGGCLMKRQDLVDMNIFESKYLNVDTECILKLMLQGDVGFINKDSYVFVRHGGNESGSMSEYSHLSRIYLAEEVYAFAKTKITASQLPELEDWRRRMLEQMIKASLYFLRMHNPPVFSSVNAFVKKNYSELLKNISKDRAWYLKIKLNRHLVLGLYRVFKPHHYKQEFSGTQKN